MKHDSNNYNLQGKGTNKNMFPNAMVDTQAILRAHKVMTITFNAKVNPLPS